jgi:CRISPR-associated exonuclease Cas4
MQCLLVEETTGQPVDHGVLEYPNRRFDIPFGDRERRYILALLDEIWLARGEGDIPRNHHDAFRCRGCGYRSREVCGQALS